MSCLCRSCRLPLTPPPIFSRRASGAFGMVASRLYCSVPQNLLWYELPISLLLLATNHDSICSRRASSIVPPSPSPCSHCLDSLSVVLSPHFFSNSLCIILLHLLVLSLSQFVFCLSSIHACPLSLITYCSMLALYHLILYSTF
jgi:hypothetical protein